MTTTSSQQSSSISTIPGQMSTKSTKSILKTLKDYPSRGSRRSRRRQKQQVSFGTIDVYTYPIGLDGCRIPGKKLKGPPIGLDYSANASIEQNYVIDYDEARILERKKKCLEWEKKYRKKKCRKKKYQYEALTATKRRNMLRRLSISDEDQKKVEDDCEELRNQRDETNGDFVITYGKDPNVPYPDVPFATKNYRLKKPHPTTGRVERSIDIKPPNKDWENFDAEREKAIFEIYFKDYDKIREDNLVENSSKSGGNREEILRNYKLPDQVDRLVIIERFKSHWSPPQSPFIAEIEPWKDEELQHLGHSELLGPALQQTTAQDFSGKIELGDCVWVKLGFGSSVNSEYPGRIVLSIQPDLDESKPDLDELRKGEVRVQLQNDKKNTYRVMPEMAVRPMDSTGRGHSESKHIVSSIKTKSVLADPDHVVMPVAGRRLRKLHFAKYMEASIPAMLMEMPDGTYRLIDKQNFEVYVYVEWIKHYFAPKFARGFITALKEKKGEWVKVPPGCRVKGVDSSNPQPDSKNDKLEHMLEYVTKDSERACSYGSVASVMAEFLSVNSQEYPEIQGGMPKLIMELGRSLGHFKFFSSFRDGLWKILGQRGYSIVKMKRFDLYHSSEVPVMAELVGIDDEGHTSNLNHIVCFFQGHVYESTWEYSRECTQEVMDEICSGLGYKFLRLNKKCIYMIRPSPNNRLPSKALRQAASGEEERMASVAGKQAVGNQSLGTNKRKQSAVLTTGSGDSVGATGDSGNLLLNGRFEPPTKRICFEHPFDDSYQTWIRGRFQPRVGLSWDAFQKNWSKSSTAMIGPRRQL